MFKAEVRNTGPKGCWSVADSSTRNLSFMRTPAIVDARGHCAYFVAFSVYTDESISQQNKKELERDELKSFSSEMSNTRNRCTFMSSV